MADDKGNANLLFKDASGGITDAAADGAEVVLTRIDADAWEFSMLVLYPKTGVTESYNVVGTGDGARQLLWTSSKARTWGGIITKVGAYTSKCD